MMGHIVGMESVEGGQSRQTRRRKETGRHRLRWMDGVEMDLRKNMIVKRW
jgi:hypothetical protein